MDVTALVMAGGKGIRLDLDEEKPLLQLGGKPVIEYVLTALRNAKNVNNIVVAVSHHSPKTAKLMSIDKISTITTPGKEYVFDLGYAVKRLNSEFVLAIAADLPFITGEIIDFIIESYQKCGKPALSVVVPIETKEKMGLGGDYVIEFGDKRVVPAGINVIDGKRIEEEELDQELCLIDRKEVAININTQKELEIAKTLIEESFPE